MKRRQTSTPAARAATDAARYRAVVARFLEVPAGRVGGEPVGNYRMARARFYGAADSDPQDDALDDLDPRGREGQDR